MTQSFSLGDKYEHGVWCCWDLFWNFKGDHCETATVRPDAWAKA